ncbi:MULTISPECIES: MFS transporter [Rhizobium]|uniref:MFS family arabinose efflux permease n=1 Tax=Rhizobium tropici TaxID=398 RepID=A0ABR6R426_RHITR|nr:MULTISPECIES: MFS transporter [Rhizobium]MBB4243628.1 putative MFS family arabinose efflux permease [Rhizobium tropici]MBB5595923.1 putative MFS family arabinose efflux permease [Rhizobium tropici]MBB6493916.1 putative MFS family arabinose efflux permease [Rhizobium tropici]
MLFAIAGGIAVGNLYWAQPLLTEIATALQVSTGTIGLLVTMTQIGYAVGVLLIVPLGDMLPRRSLIPAVMACSALALLSGALSPSFTTLAAALAAVGMTTVAGQLLTPLAGDLATPEERGKVVGTIVSGLLAGILLSRTVSGVLSDAFGWRVVYAVAALCTLLMAVVLWFVIPAEPPRPRVAYGKLILSIFQIVGRYRIVQVTLLIGALAFSVFTLFWTGLTYLLSAPPYSYSVSQIGLVGLVGLAGALAARRVGRFHDRGWSVAVTGLALCLATASLLIAMVGTSSILLVLLAVLLLDVAIQAVNVLNQSRILSVDPASRSRLNTAFVACNFIGGALGSALSGPLWSWGGWRALMLCGVSLTLLALALWFGGRETLDTTSVDRSGT